MLYPHSNFVFFIPQQTHESNLLHLPDPKDLQEAPSVFNLTHPTSGATHLLALETRGGFVWELRIRAANSVPFPIQRNKNFKSSCYKARYTL